MKPKNLRSLPRTLVVCFAPVLGLLASHAQAAEALFSSSPFTSDATSGVSKYKTYAALGNVVAGTGAANGGNVVVNGATFTAGATTGTGWSVAGMGGNFASGGNKTSTFGGTASGQAIDDLFDGFLYNGNPGTINFSNLTVGQVYVATLYCQNFSNPAASVRQQYISTTEGARISFNEDAAEASMLRYTFVATSGTSTFTVRPEIAGTTFHLYGLSNEQVFNDSWLYGTDWTTAGWFQSAPTTYPTGVGSNADLPAQDTPTTLNLDSSQTIGHIQFDGASPWTLSTSNSSILTLQTDLGGYSVLSVVSGSHVISTPIVLNSDVVKVGPGTLSLTGTVSGSNSITITGGTLAVGQTLTYTGATTIGTGATLDLNDTVQTIASLNGGGTVLNNGSSAKVLTVSSGKFSGAITDHTTGTGTLALTKTGSGTFTITNPSTYSGVTVINDGTLRLEGSGSPLLADNFTTTGTGSNTDLNYNLANRQTGSAAPKNIVASTAGTGNIQVGNATAVQQPATTAANYLLLAYGSTASIPDLALSSANVPGPLKISFDMFKGSPTVPVAGDDTNWTSFAIRGTAGTAGIGANGQPTGTGAADFGFLTRRSGGVQVFNNNAAIENIDTPPAGDSFTFYLADFTGTGSPFGTGGTRVFVAKSGTVIGSYKLAGQMATEYLNFSAQSNKISGMDNLGVYPAQANLIPATSNLSLTSATSVLELENSYQTLAQLSGVAGSSINLGPTSSITLNTVTGTPSTFAGSINGAGSLIKLGADTLTLSGTTSTYAGTTIFAAGTINVASLSNYGAPGSLGSRVADSSSNVGLLFRGGTLAYTGSTPQSTNRGIRLSTTGGGGIINASGTVPTATLSFTATTTPDLFENSGSRGLTLTGTNTGANTFAMALGAAGTTNFAKAGTGTWFLTSTASSYNGVSFLQGGILNVASLSDYGVNGSLGNRASDAAGNVGTLFEGGTLQYTGATPQSTNRGIRVSTAGGTIDASGSVPTATLSFTATTSADFFENGGTRTLTFTGTNTGLNTFNIVTGDAGGATSLVKNGTGTWVLSGTNTYGGTTNINAGILRITNSAALGVGSLSTATKTTIAAGATLEMMGNLTVPEHMHIQGAGMGGIGAIHSVSGTSTLSQNIAFDADTTIGVDADTLTISSVVYHDTGSFGLTKTGAGTLALTGVNTYTGTTTVAGGVLALNGKSIADAGKLVISGGVVNLAASSNETVGTLFYGTTQQAAGTYGSSASTATFKDDTRFSGTGILTVASGPSGDPYAAWASVITNPTDRAKTADPDHDGFTNLQEYLFGANPVANTGALVTVQATPGGLVVLWCERASGTYVLQQSADLATWTTSSVTPTVAADQTGLYSADYTRKQAIIPVDSSKKFVRVKGTTAD